MVRPTNYILIGVFCAALGGCVQGPTGPALDLLSGAKQPIYVDAITYSFREKPDTKTLAPKLQSALETLRSPRGSTDNPVGRAVTLNVHITNFFDMGGAQSLLIGGMNHLSWSVRIKDSKSGSPLYQEDLQLRSGYALGGIVGMIIEASRDDEARLTDKMARVVRAKVLHKHNIVMASDVTVAMRGTQPVEDKIVAGTKRIHTVTPSNTTSPKDVTIKPAAPAGSKHDKSVTPLTRRISNSGAGGKPNSAQLLRGRLQVADIKNLFSGLVVTTDQASPETHSFRADGRLDGSVPETNAGDPSNGRSESEDSGSWHVSGSGHLCIKWWNWDSGQQQCYRVSKKRNGIALNSNRARVNYRIEKRQIVSSNPSKIDAARMPQSQGPLQSEDIKQLFSNLIVTTEQATPETHSFRPDGRLDGSVPETNGGYPSNNRSASEDSGSWHVSSSGQLCIKWRDWDAGQQYCYGVSRYRNNIILTDGRSRIQYRVERQRTAGTTPQIHVAAKVSPPVKPIDTAPTKIAGNTGNAQKIIAIEPVAHERPKSQLPQTTSEDHVVGSKNKDVFRIAYNAGHKAVPLPPGEWILVSRLESRSLISNVPIVKFHLLRHTDKAVTGAIQIRTHKELVDFGWSASKICSEKNRRVSWYFADNTYEGHEDCNIVYPIRGFNRRDKSLKQIYSYIESHGLTGPNAWIVISYSRVKGDEMMQAHYALPPEHYGFARERRYSDQDSPWSIDNIDGFPKRKAFMHKVVEWAKSWQGLVDNGFQNQFDRVATLGHPTIADVI